MEYYTITDTTHVGKTIFEVLRPYYSVRTLRSYIRYGAIYVNNYRVSKKYIVQYNDVIRCAPPYTSYAEPLVVLMETQDYIAIYKAPYMHTSHISGKPTPSMEATIRKEYDIYALCTRLDYMTSGMLFIARTKSAYEHFKEEENNGLIQKTYITLVKGLCPVQSISYSMRTSKTKRSHVLNIPHSDVIRHTHIVASQPIRIDNATYSLLTCCIYKGARHQIRAHLAYQGFPIVGDYLYNIDKNTMPFLLHNARVTWRHMELTLPIPEQWNNVIPHCMESICKI